MNFNKKKVVFVMGATATGKTKLSIDLAIHFSGEAINSDKIQVYKGLDIATNKVTESERQGVPHHLLGFVDPEADYPVEEFCEHALRAIDKIIENGHLPIIVGGSNTYIEALVEDSIINFRANYDCCFIWMDVDPLVLYKYVGIRVDKMVEAGLVDEVRDMFDPNADYNRGIRRSIGAPELHEYLKLESNMKNETTNNNKELLLKKAIQETKDNTCKLVDKQVQKIKRLRNELGWKIHRIDATYVLERRMKDAEDAEDAWEEVVLKPGVAIVEDFLNKSNKNNYVGEESYIASWVNFLKKFLLPFTRMLRGE